MLKKSLSTFALLVGLTSSASAMTCISEANFKAQKPNLDPYVHTITQDDGAEISLYVKDWGSEEDGFNEKFLVVIRKDRCIVSMDILDRKQVDDRYQVYGSWSELVEAASGDNEGMDDEGGTASALSEDDLFPFLSLENRAVPQIYNGPMKRPDFKGRDRDFADFRTRILESMSQGVNFSGEYRITQIGCGSSCSFAVLSNLRTGEQFDFPRGGEESGPLSLKFSANSSLMISTWKSGDDCFLESLLFDGQNWVTLANPSLGGADLCYENIDENIERYKTQTGAPADADGASVVNEKSVPTSNSQSVAASPKEFVDNKTAFRGLSLGMTKDQAMSIHVDGFKQKFSKAVSVEGLTLPGSVEFFSTSGEVCAIAYFDKKVIAVDEMNFLECFFLSKDANLQKFTKKFADSYSIDSMVPSLKRSGNAELEESFEGDTKFGETVNIYKVSGINKYSVRFEQPIKIRVKGNSTVFD